MAGHPLHPRRGEALALKQQAHLHGAGGGQVPGRVDAQDLGLGTDVTVDGDAIADEIKDLDDHPGDDRQDWRGRVGLRQEQGLPLQIKDFDDQPLIRDAGHDMALDCVADHTFARARGQLLGDPA